MTKINILYITLAMHILYITLAMHILYITLAMHVLYITLAMHVLSASNYGNNYQLGYCPHANKLTTYKYSGPSVTCTSELGTDTQL